MNIADVFVSNSVFGVFKYIDSRLSSLEKPFVKDENWYCYFKCPTFDSLHIFLRYYKVGSYPSFLFNCNLFFMKHRDFNVWT